MKYYLATLICTVTACLGAQNLIYNGNFDLGTAGYADELFIDPVRNPDLRYTAPQIENKDNPELKISCPYGEMFRLYLKEIPLAANNQYTLSFDTRSSLAKQPLSVFIEAQVIPKNQGEDATVRYSKPKVFQTNDQMTRYHYTFTTDANAALQYYTVRFEWFDNENLPGADIRLDNISLVGGNQEMPMSASDQLQIAVDTAKNLYTIDQEKEVKITTKIFNDQSQNISDTVTVTVTDDCTGDVIKQFTHQFNLKSNQRIDLDDMLPINRYGSFTVRAKAASLAPERQNSLHGTFAVIGQYQHNKVDLMRDFVVGLDGGVGYMQNFGKRPGYRSCGMGPKERLQYLSLMGCRLMRDWGNSRALKWKNIEPKENSYDFSFADREISLYEQNQIELMPVLGGWEFLQMWSNASLMGYPDWLRQKSETVPAKNLPAPLLQRWPKLEVQLAPQEDWQRMIKTVAERYRGKIHYYEIFNEPNFGGGDGCLPPSVYLPYLKNASEVIKATDPQAKVVGFCATGDFGGRLGNFLQKSFELGGLEYADVVSFHPYADRQMGTLHGGSADELIHSLQTLIKKYAGTKQIPLWNTELYYLHGKETNFEANFFEPRYLATRFLLDLGEGVGQGTYFSFDYLFQNRICPGNRVSRVNFLETRPSANFVVFNTLARLFEAAKPVKRFVLPNQVVVYLYIKDGKYQSALWHFGEFRDLKLSAASARLAVRKTDLFGNKLTNQSLPVTDSPLYFFYDSADLAAIESEIGNLAIAPENPVQLYSLKKAGDSLYLNIGNKNAQPLTVIAAIGKANAQAALPPAANQSLRFPVGENTGSYTVRIAAGKIFEWPNVTVTPVGAAAADGQWHDIGNPTKQNNGENVKGRFCFTQTPTSLLLKVEVSDATDPGFLTGRNPWEQDGIELFIQTNAAEPGPGLRLFVNPGAPAGKQLSTNDPKLAFPCKVERNKDGYTVELTLPMTALGIQPGDFFGFEIAVDDASAEGKVSQRFWSNQKDEAWQSSLHNGIITTNKGE